MKSFLVSLFIFVVLSFSAKSQTDLKVTISENSINKIFTAIGTISGEGEYKIVQTKKFNWILTDTRIDLIQDSAIFITNAEVKTHLGTYKDEIHGKVSITYDSKTNLISIRVVDAIFEIVLPIGKTRLVLKRIQLADYFITPIQFEGPANISNDMTFQMPNGEIKKLFAKPTNLKMRVIDNAIVVSTDISFSNDTLHDNK
jgi:hypothetical protein